MKVFANRQSFQSGKSFRPWLYTIATHAAVDAMRRRKRHTQKEKISIDKRVETDEGTAMIGNLLESSDSNPLETLLRQEDRQLTLTAV